MEFHKKEKIFTLMIVLCIFLRFSVGVAHGQDALPATPAQPLSSGVEFLEPKVELLRADGNWVTLKSMRGSVLILYFFATWCSSCSEELRSLGKLQQELKFLDIQDCIILPISVDYKSAPDVGRFLEGLKISDMPFYVDNKKAAMAAFGVKSLPTTIMIDHRGFIFDKIDTNVNWAHPDIIKALINLIELKRHEARGGENKAPYNPRPNNDVIYRKESGKKVTIIN